MSTLKAPVTAGEIDDTWIAERREIILRDGYALRAGAGNTIEANRYHDGNWRVITLPNEATTFVTETDRDAVLARLNGKTK
jgi:hypothetical protein